MGRAEFVALIALMTASVAFAIDAMLPALPDIAAELSPGDPERAPLILSTFLLGMGLGTFVAGPISDALGRKRVILLGALLYCVGAIGAWFADTLTPMLIARLVQGLGAAGPRVVSMAVIRDRFAGRQMAQIVSIVMMIFVLVPAVAPMLGALIIAFAGWRGIFVAFVVFSAIYVVWMLVRLPETLPPKDRRPMRAALMRDAVAEIFRDRMVRLSILAQTLVMSMLFLTLMLVQPIYDTGYGRGDEFPFWFCGIALIAGTASLLNAVLVVRFGMINLTRLALGVQIVISAAFVAFDLGAGPNGFYFFVFWQTCIFFQAGLTIGNLNALAMEPMGHIAGMAASVIGAVSTVGAAVISGLVTALIGTGASTLFLAVLVLAAAGSLTMLRVSRTVR
ncbi:multidrug effflux MFS transporter [Sulfitobacter albidus]|uniref:Multidrug effflux MFS transporter n=2 Tax=Sulfitobacter albidus TaxID=2829501 RepID=A0A975JGA3_9RHOB|nr:multidrug effflux MFS transporter [Sulfitobacter albidus]QUJ77979.1 multidrug effflux MFS transporter [Sulfitobacter albidus]